MISTAREMGARKWRAQGFALVASLTLMMLLGMIAIGILVVIASQSRIANHSIMQVAARQQALMGLDAAIADLQVELGPDQRVSASSGILSEEEHTPQHILGVWNSWSVPLYGQKEGEGIASTYTKGRAKMFRRWLISCTDGRNLHSLDALRELGQRAPGKRVLLLGSGTLGHQAKQSDYIYADLVSVPIAGNNEACYAWWIGGENQKANVSVRQRTASDDPAEILRRTWDTPPPSFHGNSRFSFFNSSDKDTLQKPLTLRSLPLAAHVSAGDGTPYFHDVTLYSYTLPVNVRDGGLKYDLNLLLNKRSLAGTDYAPRSSQDCPLAEEDCLPVGTEANMPIGSWQVLHAYHNTWPNGSVNKQAFSSRLQGNVSSAYSVMSGHITRETTKWGDDATFYDSRSIDGDASAGYANTPVLLSFMGAYGLSLGDPTPGFGAPPNNYSHGITYAPFCLWWNPYNVPIRVGSKKLWFMSLPYRTLPSLLSLIGSQWNRWNSIQSVTPPVDGNGSIGQKNGFGNDWGNYCINSISDQSSDIVFEPGEIIAFSMSEGWNNMEKLAQGDNSDISYSQPQAVPFIIGDHAGMLNNYFNSVYSYQNRCGVEILITLETQDAYSNSIIKTVIDSGDGDMSRGKVNDSPGDIYGPGAREAMVVTHGFDGIDASSESNKTVSASRLKSKPYSLTGAGAVSPQNFTLGWYDYDKDSAADLQILGPAQGYTWNPNMYKTANYFMAIGVAPKSINPNYNQGIPKFRGKDYRSKVWQHSSPALGSSALYKPDDQQRQYHPYQLATVEMGQGLSRGALDTPNDRNGVYGLSSLGSGGGESVSFISVLELPVHPPFSLAGFAGMRLTPGWYSTSGSDSHLSSLARNRRMQYQAGVPGVGIGNAFADPCLPPGDVYAFHENNLPSSLSSNGRLFSDFYDHGLIINDALWDRWFCSSMADMPSNGGVLPVREVVENFVRGKADLPVSRYKCTPSPISDQQIINDIMSENGWRKVARYIMIEGGFNVNSVSEEAWAAVLLGLAKRDLVSNAGGQLHKVQKENEGDVLFSRFMVSTSDHSIDDEGGYNVVEGSASVRPNLKLATAWGDIRALSPDGIRELARQMVKKVRERGPFLNMSDFINRRLDGGSDDALAGALQAAIDATDINAAFIDDNYHVSPQKSGSLYRYPKAEEGSMYTAAPGYLIQSDVLASLGNILTVRDDTFVVRAYGCVRSPAGAVLSQAWCEAVVQRTLDYVDPNNTPEDAPLALSNTRTGKTHGLTLLNQMMGRRFRVVSFRWLDHWDI